MRNAESRSSDERFTLTRRQMLGLSTTAAGLAAAGMTGCVPGGGSAAGPNGAKTASGATDPVRGTAVDDAQASRVTAPAPVGVLGANVNQDLNTLNFAELRAVSATWLRGFYLMQNADQGNVADQPGMRKLTTAIKQGYGTAESEFSLRPGTSGQR